MVETKYGKYIMPATVKKFREGENPSLEFKAGPHGVDAIWAVMAVTKELEPNIQKELRENLHKHEFHQCVTFWGSNPYDTNEFEAEMSNCIGEEHEEHIVNYPAMMYLPPGLVHGFGQTPMKINKPMYHLDLSFVSEYNRTNLPDPEAEAVKPASYADTAGKTRYGKYLKRAATSEIIPGEAPALDFNAGQYGISAQWTILARTRQSESGIPPHTHGSHQFTTFFGSNPYDIGEFDAEITIYFGEEREKHVITSPTVVHFPPGLVHHPDAGPARIGKPIYELVLTLAARV